MRRLLSANFARLRKDRSFWCLLVIIVAISLVSVWTSDSIEVMESRGYAVRMEDYYFGDAPVAFMGVFFALFASLFLGTEYSDGTIRNKLAVGHRRDQVFLAGFFTCLTASVVILTGWLVTGCLYFLLIGLPEMGMPEFSAYILVAVGFTASFSALFTLVGSLSSNKAMTVIYTLAIYLLLLLLAAGINDRLCEPETQGGMAYIDGAFTMLEPTPNSLYLSGNVRRFWECVLDFLPTGQAILMNEVAIEHPLRELGSSVVLTIAVLFAGCRAFRKKDIK